MLRNYRAPNGRTYQYDEGTQPDGYVEVEAEQSKAKAAQPKTKARRAPNKARRATTK